MLYYNPLCNYALDIVMDEHVAEDIVQDVFLYLWKKNVDLDENKNIKNFLFTSVKNKCLEVLRQDKAYQKRITDYSNEQNTQIFDDEEKGWDNWVKIDQIYSSLRHLPPKCKEVFVLAKINGLTYTQISQKLNISPKTVENHMAKALAMLRRLLKEK